MKRWVTTLFSIVALVTTSASMAPAVAATSSATVLASDSSPSDCGNRVTLTATVTPPGTNTYTDLVYSALFKVVAKDNAGQYGDDSSNNFFSIFDPIVEVVLTRLDAEAGPDGITLKWALQNPRAFASVTVERSEAESGPWNAIETVRHDDGNLVVAVDGSVAPGGIYFIRYVTPDLKLTQRWVIAR